MFSRRPDAQLAQNLSSLRTLMPQILRKRMDAVVFLRYPVEIDSTRAWLEAENAQRPEGDRVTLFHVVLASLVRTLQERPDANRFVKGGRLWERDHVALTFAVKKSFSDKGRLVSTKVRFTDGDDLDDVLRAAKGAIGESRGDSSKRERNVRRGGGLPLPLRGLAVRGSDLADRMGLLPASMVDNSPLHTSAMLSNVGSIGLDGVLHHLYEQGTCSINMTLGAVKREMVVDDDGTVRKPFMAPITFAYDERIADGYYMARTIERFAGYVADPQSLRRAGVTPIRENRAS